MKSITKKIRQFIASSIKKGKYKEAICGMSALSYYNYTINQFFRDEEIEHSILELSNRIINKEKIDTISDTIFFYDGFGLETRGLIQIYMTSLTKKYKVIYMTKKSKQNAISWIKNLVNKSGGKVIYFDDFDYLSAISDINNAIKKFCPFRIFIYTTPFDIPSAIVFSRYNSIIRFMINLTDHAYWTGLNSFDYCIEFRNFGASISHQYRGIDKDRLILLPFYPYIDEDKEFEGFPFDKNNRKVVFSGGALYKTHGGNSLYYKTIRKVLKELDNVILWYAGTGDSSKLDELIREFPERVYHTPERPDLFQVMKNIDIYYSTYPILGGLMLQYAAVAGKIPLTLKGSQISDDFLINQNDLGVIFTDSNDLVNEMILLLEDDNYRARKEAGIKNAVISKEKFQRNLEGIIDNCKSEYEIREYKVQPREYQDDYLQYISFASFSNAVAQRNNTPLIKAFPGCYIYKMYMKLRGM
jgi:hypothetical protein